MACMADYYLLRSLSSTFGAPILCLHLLLWSYRQLVRERERERELEFLVFQWEIETEGERDSREIEEARFKPFLTVKS